ncbi:daptide biosynthesis intramembrane metalloprotease [Streptomyces cacaoi]
MITRGRGRHRRVPERRFGYQRVLRHGTRRGHGSTAGRTAEPDTALLTRPRLASDVLVHEPIEKGAPWVVQRGAQQYIRVGSDLVRLLHTMDGARDHAGLVDTLGPPWTERDVERAVRNLHRMRLLEDGTPRRRSSTWFKFVPPLTLQFTMLKPERLLRAATPLLRSVANRFGAVLAVCAALGGLLALALQAPVLRSALGKPLPLSFLMVLGVASLVTTALHEMGHGAVLTYHGGRPSRMGVMLFYMTPAFFCDVSDGWRLPRKEQRVHVALAGIVTQMVIAGSAAIAALIAGADGTGGAWDAVLVFAVSTYVTGTLNLLPFVKLDGYIALMTHLDVPHLRDRAMTDARRFLARVLFGGRYERELPSVRWSVPFGLACMVFPLYLIGLASSLWLDLLQGMGVIGAAVVLTGISYLLYRAWTGGRKIVQEARGGGAHTGRIVTAGVLTAAAVTAALTLVQVPYKITAGFVRDGDRTTLVLSEAADRDSVTPGTHVTLIRRGMVTRSPVGTAVVADGSAGEARKGTAPLSAFIPVREAGALPVPAYRVGLETPAEADEPDAGAEGSAGSAGSAGKRTAAERATDGARAGMAQVPVGDRPLGSWLYLTYIAPALR